VTSIRKLGALTLAVPLAVGIVAFGPGTAAQADTAIKRPADKAVISSGSATTVTAHIDLLQPANLYVDGPGSGEQRIGGGTGPRDISSRVATNRNGPYVVRLKGLLGEVIDQRTFYVRVPPKQPTGVDTSVSAHKLVVRWARGPESDLAGYDVFAAGAKARRGSAGALCSGQVCSTALSIPATGGRTEVGVRALRSDGSGHLLASRLSKTSVLLPGSSAYSGGHGLTGLPPQGAGPVLPLEGRTPLSLPAVSPYGSQGFQYPTPAPQVAGPARSPHTENASSSGPLQWGKSIAIALILLIIAAHLGAWTRRQRLAQAAAGTGDRSADASADRESSVPEGDKPATEATPPAAKAATGATAPDAGQSPDVVGRSGAWPRNGSLIDAKAIDAKGSMADATMLSAGSQPRQAGRGGESTANDVRPAAVGAARRTSAYNAKTPAVRSKATNSKGKTTKSKSGSVRRRSASGYRGRRRAD
jgi:hypothetical protein